jgi:hypothetical protein
VATITLTTLLAGCHPAKEASPEVERPVAEREVVSVEKNTQGEVLIPSMLRTEFAGTPGVYVMQNGQARFRMIKTGKQSGKLIAVSSGLAGTETLVSGPYDGIYDGSPVRPIDETR